MLKIAEKVQKLKLTPIKPKFGMHCLHSQHVHSFSFHSLTPFLKASTISQTLGPRKEILSS